MSGTPAKRMYVARRSEGSTPSLSAKPTRRPIVADPAKIRPSGEMDEWFKSHAWKACVRRKTYRGFESHSLRQQTCPHRGAFLLVERVCGRTHWVRLSEHARLDARNTSFRRAVSILCGYRLIATLSARSCGYSRRMTGSPNASPSQSHSKYAPIEGHFCWRRGCVDEPTGSTIEHPVNVQLNVSAAPARTVLSLEAKDARIAEAMRAAHNPTAEWLPCFRAGLA